MAALIFRRSMNLQDPIPYADWLEDLGEPIVLFTMGEASEDSSFAHVEKFESFDNQGLTEVRALELAERFTYHRIFAQSEHDLLRAAELREWFGVKGQSYSSAWAFRDKFHMKTLAKAGGMEVPCFAALATPLDLYRFGLRHGFPCVVKPRKAAGARGICVLRSLAQLKQFLQKPLGEDYMAESFVDGPMFHVDGLMSAGRILFVSASKYVNNCISYQDGQSSGSVLLDPAQPLSERLVSKTEQLLSSLPLAPHFAFHAEFFIDEADRIVFCEVAARPGGSGIVGMIEQAYGVNLYQQWVRRSFDLPIELPAAKPWTAVGLLWVPPQRGRLCSMPASVPFEWVVEYRPHSKTGQWWEHPQSNGPNIASFTVSGSDTEQVESRIRMLDEWFRERVEWEENPELSPAEARF